MHKTIYRTNYTIGKQNQPNFKHKIKLDKFEYHRFKQMVN